MQLYFLAILIRYSMRVKRAVLPPFPTPKKASGRPCSDAGQKRERQIPDWFI